MAEKNELSFFGAGKNLVERIFSLFKTVEKNIAIVAVNRNGSVLYSICTDYYFSGDDCYRLAASAESLASIAARSGFCTGWYEKKELKDAFQKIEEVEADILLDVLGGIPVYGNIGSKPTLFGAIGVAYDYDEDKVGDFKKALEDIKSIMSYSNYLWFI